MNFLTLQNENSPSKQIMNKRLTILAAPMQAVGHINACAGALTGLAKRGHRVIFVLTKLHEGKLNKMYGYEEYIVPLMEENGSQMPFKSLGASSASLMQKTKVLGLYTPKEKKENYLRIYESPGIILSVGNFDKAIASAIEKYRPDLLYADAERFPAIMYSAIPWIYNMSAQPLGCNLDDTLPPAGSGFATDSDPSEWSEWSELRWLRKYKLFNDIVEKLGYPRFPGDEYPQTQLFSVYAIPEEINYPQLRDNQSWFNIEVFNKPEALKSEATKLADFVPQVFLDNDLGGNFSGKLIYVSLGSMGSADLDIMSRLVTTLAKTNHKYIVSTGPRHDEYELAPNMWGGEYLPQTSIIPHVDLVLTHGGNNSVTETFAIGKPMIVLPLFLDQYDNAQRLHETGFGVRIDAYAFTESELTEAIDKILNDSELKHKLKDASQRILASNHHEKLALLIENKLREN